MTKREWKQKDPAGIIHEMVTYTGDGGGEITFQDRQATPAVTPGPVPDHDDDPAKILKLGETSSIGTRLKRHWESYGQELATRDEGDRGLPLDYQPPNHKALGIRDHKEATAARMMEALHAGNADYFAGLAKALLAYNKLGGKTPQLQHEDIRTSRSDGLAAIRTAAQKKTKAQKIPSVPTVEEVNDCYWQSSCSNKDFRKQTLIPLGFGWLPRAPKGRPK